MAKPYNEINRTDFRNNYNIVRILTDINDIMNELKTFNSKNQAVAFGVKKHTEPDKLDLILERLEKIETNQSNDHKLLVETNSLLLKVIKLNNLKTE